MQPTISAKARDLVWRRKELLGAGIAVVVAVGIIPREHWVSGFGFFSTMHHPTGPLAPAFQSLDVQSNLVYSTAAMLPTWKR